MKILAPALFATMQLCAGPLSPLFSGHAVIKATVSDGLDNLYLAGWATQDEIPITPGAYQSYFAPCQNASLCLHGFIAKISSRGDLVFATYISGFDSGESISAIAIDASQNIYVTGNSWANPGGSPSVGFVQRFSADGSKLLGSTSIVSGQPSAVAIAPRGDVFIAGSTDCGSTCTFSTTTGAFQSTNQGGADAFVMRFDAALSTLIYSTLLGGAGNDFAYDIAATDEGEAYVTGGTTDTRSFPTTPGAVVQHSNFTDGIQEVFATKINASGSEVIFSAVFGPNSSSAGTRIAVDASGVYVFGDAGSGFVVPPTAFMTTGTQFAAKLTPDGTALIYETRLPGGGGGSPIQVSAVSADGAGNLLIFSSTGGLVPTTPDSFDPCTRGGPNQFVLELSPSGAARTYGTYVPGGLAMRVDGQVWYHDGTGDVHSFNIHHPLPPGPRCATDSLSYLSGAIAPGKLVSLFGPAIGPNDPSGLQIDASGKVATDLSDVSVYFNGIAAPLLYVSKNQINAVVPFEIAGPSSTIVVLNKGMELDGPTVAVASVAPEFVMTSEGCIAAVNPDGSVNSESHPAVPGSVVTVFGEGAGLMDSAETGAIGQGASRILAVVRAELQVWGTGFPGFGPPRTAPMEVVYAGDAPGYVEGVFKLNLKLPDSFASGKQWIHIYIGPVSSGGTCLWIR